MAASVSRSTSAKHPNEGLQPLRLSRDLYQVAELIELGFAGRLDAQGRASIREMKAMARLGPLLWIISFLNQLGLGHEMGFVWREEGRVVGNTSLYRAGYHPFLKRGWMIANVVVHPDYRRRGYARQLMQAALHRARGLRGEWAALQVESNNLGAIALYEELGFKRYERLEQWKTANLKGVQAKGLSSHTMRLRRMAEGDAEAALIFNRARRGGMAWTMPLDRSHLIDFPLSGLGGLPEGRQKERWVLIDSAAPDSFAAGMWVEANTLRRAKITYFPDRTYVDDEVLGAFLASMLNRSPLRDRSIRLETTAGIPAVDAVLRAAGFYRTRTFYQMRIQL